MDYINSLPLKVRRIICSSLLILSIFSSLLQWAVSSMGENNFLSFNILFLINPILTLVIGFLLFKTKHKIYNILLSVSFTISVMFWIFSSINRIFSGSYEGFIDFIVIGLPSLLSIWFFITLSRSLFSKKFC